MNVRSLLFAFAFLLFGASALMAQTVTVTSPNGGETLYACQTYTITWTQTGSPSNYWNISYSLNGGTTWNAVTSNFLSTNGQFSWTLPTTTSTTVKVRVVDAQNSATTDQSNANFTIAKSITVTAPNGGETWAANTVQNITWTAAGTSGNYNIAYSTDGGINWTTIVSNYAASGTYAWTVPNSSTTNALVRVQDAAATCKTDNSNAVFAITAAAPVLITPNGGESLNPNCTTNITWNTATIAGTATLEYSTDNGTTWNNIVTGTANDGTHTWTVPNAPSTQCKIRITDTNTSLTDVSNANFTIIPPITVTSPNGGETWVGCATYPITWTKSTCLTYFNIYYSTDAGATWVSIANAVAAIAGSTQSYNWAVPNTLTSTQVRFKVEDYYNPTTMFDVSNANLSFTPNNYITVTAPNGGQTWTGNTTQNITWTNTAGVSGTYTLYYSINNGTSWTTIVSGVTGNTYAWTVPNNPSANCLIRVIDSGNSCIQDVSNAIFTIAAATPILLTPNGGETLTPGCATTITWNTASFYSTVRLDYSLDNGTTWTAITTNTANDGTENWTVPYTPSTTCLVKASNYANALSFDVSNTTFTIPAAITVTSPNGGQSWIGCSTYPITWTASTCITYFNVYYSTDNGATWVSVASAVSNSGTANQSYSWQVPNTLTSSQVKFKVEDYYNPTTNFDVSNNVSTFTPSADITVTAPNGGQSWTGLSTQNITWTNTAGASGQYTLQYSTNGGSSWSSIATNVTGNSYAWTVPNIPSTTCLIRVYDYINTCKFDVSNANFTIVAATPILLTPNGGETLSPGCATTITWNTTTFYSTVKLEYTIDNGTNWIAITNSTTNDGTETWTVPATASTQCKVRASNVSDLTKFDISNAVFTISPPITVTSPNGGENWIGCTSYNIGWTKSTCLTYFNIYYSTDNGTTWTSVANAVASNGLATQTYSWQVPNTLTSSQVKFKVEDYYNPTTSFDISNAVSTFTPSADITVTAPNGGQTWTGLSAQTITWTNTAGASGQYTLQYSLNNGSSWSNIATNITGNSYSWTVPNSPSTTCLIRIYDYVNTCKFDVSNAVFTIAAAGSVLLTPNGGETLSAGCSTTITWDASTFFSNVKLEYTIDNGTTWIVITNATANDGSETWTVPATASTQCKVRATNTSDVTKFDVSNTNFTIAVPITITTPNGGETWINCNTYPITFTKSTCLSYFNIYYSTDNGTTWVALANAVGSNGLASQTYSWTVPVLTSSQVRFKVEDYYAATTFDITDAPMTLAPNTDITVTSPNGGETVEGFSTKIITWTNTANVSGQYSLQYSTNGGTNWTTIANNITGNSYAWTVPNSPSTTAQIRIYDYLNSCKSDVSNANFTIASPDPKLLTSNGNESIYSGSSYNITWNTAYMFSTARLDYSLDNGATWVNIVSNTANTGSYTWTVPNANSNQCVLRLSNYSNQNSYDVSDYVFTIKPPITILTPNGSDDFDLGGCTLTSITFDHSPAYNTFDIEYSTDNGSTWTTIVTDFVSNANPATYDWDLPNIQSTQTKVRVKTIPSFATCSGAIYVPSSGTGSCTVGTTPVTIYDHAGTGSYSNSVNGSYNICPASSAGKVTVSFSFLSVESCCDRLYIYNGTTSTGTLISSYTSTPPTITSTASDGCLGFQFTSDGSVVSSGFQGTVSSNSSTGAAVSDESNAAFTIAKPLNITTPNTGGILQVGSTYNITWAGDGSSNLFDVFYSTDGGASFTPIAVGFDTETSTLPWTVPNTPSTNCKIWVRDNTNSCKSDTTDIPFTIATAAAGITVSSINAPGVVLTGCFTRVINWIETAAYGTYKIEYSIDGGNTWITIVASLATTAKTYTWTVPNIDAARCLVRVSSATNPAIYDVNNAFFAIRSSRVIATPATATVCSGETLQLTATGGTTYTWTPSGAGLSSTTIANPIATPTTATNYIVQSVVGVCTLKDTVAVAVVNAPISVIQYNSATAPAIIRMCIGQTRTLTSQLTGAGYTYTWYRAGYLNNDGVVVGNAATFTATNPGKFYLVITSPDGCSTQSSAVDISIDVCNPNPVGGGYQWWHCHHRHSKRRGYSSKRGRTYRTKPRYSRWTFSNVSKSC